MHILFAYLEAALYALIIVGLIVGYYGLFASNVFYKLYLGKKTPQLRIAYNGFDYQIQQKTNFFDRGWTVAKTLGSYKNYGNYGDRKSCEKEYAELHELWDKKVAEYKVVTSYVDTDMYKKLKGDK